MRSVAATLERRHASAVKVRLAKRRGLVPAGNHVTPAAGDDVSADQLVFYTISPDYCLPDRSVGSAGTRHRWTITHARTHARKWSAPSNTTDCVTDGYADGQRAQSEMSRSCCICRTAKPCRWC